MPSQSKPTGGVPRRRFLKVAGATSVTLGLAGCASQDDGAPTETDTETPEPTTEEPPEELPEPEALDETAETAYTVDHYGAVQVHVNDEGVAHSVSYLEEGPLKPSVEGPGYRDRTYAPARIKYPMKRKGWEPGGDSSGEGRGKEEFVRISWEEAYDIIAEEYERVIDEYGNEAIYGASYGWDSGGSLGSAVGALHRFLNLQGGFIQDSENYSLAAQMVAAPYTWGTMYPSSNNWMDIKENTELMIWWGSDPEVTGDIASECTHTEPLLELRNAGVDQVFINPRVTESQLLSDGELIDIRMNTDTAMMAAIGYTLLDEDLHDQEFLDEYTVGFDEFKSYLMGEDDGQPKTPEWAEEITGVPADTIRDLARRMVENRTLMNQGWGPQRGDHGEQPIRMMAAIGAMVGQIGLPGGGTAYGIRNLGSMSPKGSGPGGFPVPSNPVGGERLSDTSIPVAKIADMLLNPGEEYQYDGQTWTYPDIEMIHWVGGNPFHHHQDTNKLVEAWQKPETIIVNEINWTPTAEFADLVLPAVTRLEAPDVGGVGRAVVANQQPIDPIFEAKDDYIIFKELAEKMGFGLQYTEGNTRMDWIESFYSSSDVPLDFQEFWENEGYYTFEVNEEPFTAYERFRNDPEANSLNTPSGLIEITSPRLKEYDLDDCPAVPKWIEPDAWLGDEKTSEYPFHMMTPHPRWRLHSEFDNVPMLRKHSKVANREPVWINARDAAEKGIEDGDVVRLWNDRAEVLAGAVVTERIKPNHVALSYGSWYEPEEPGEIGTLGLDGNANALCSDTHTSSLAQGPDGKSQLVDIEKHGGDM